MHHLLLFDLWYYVHGFIVRYQDLLVTLMLGAVAGLIAQMILPGRGFGMISTLIIGIIGCIAGNKLLSPYYKYLTQYRLLNHLICAIAATMVIAFVINIIRGGQDKDKTAWRNH
jgi:uncharacterized membrane protein YeaQ/YmgE (transglycosylase-associated protein family)